jgi:L-lactate utilization protein LutB
VPEAFQAWKDALKIARDDVEREGVHVHFARWQRTAGDYAAVRRELSQVTNQMYAVTKERILKSLERKETPATNAPPKL